MNPKRAERVGLSVMEYGRVCELLGREPGDVELDLFGVMWSDTAATRRRAPCCASCRRRGRAFCRVLGRTLALWISGMGWQSS